MAEDTGIGEKGEIFDCEVTEEGIAVSKKADKSIEKEESTKESPRKKKE